MTATRRAINLPPTIAGIHRKPIFPNGVEVIKDAHITVLPMGYVPVSDGLKRLQEKGKKSAFNPPIHMSAEKLNKIIDMLAEGKSQSQIIKAAGTGSHTVVKIRRQYEKEIERRKG